jgi:hypothetical protein
MTDVHALRQRIDACGPLAGHMAIALTHFNAAQKAAEGAGLRQHEKAVFKNAHAQLIKLLASLDAHERRMNRKAIRKSKQKEAA